ncbi:hypothetical protein AVEN_122838-1 [Araneus ventricosus]|uniref:Uncharacterized protein n=1 Tax=Araneus ventricosus TaxID=182803 RepID=A0A4Y2LPV6_ARAVE|nr:hypothetical protein AVEN_122838-1 [Araneus ventricosus]
MDTGRMRHLEDMKCNFVTRQVGSPKVVKPSLNRFQAEQNGFLCTSNTAQKHRIISASRATSALPKHPSLSEEWSLRLQSEPEVGVLTAITFYGESPSEGGTGVEVTGPHLYYAHQANENPIIYPAASHPRTCGAPGRR